MEVSTSPHKQAEPIRNLKPNPPPSMPYVSSRNLAPVNRTSPLRHGIMMGAGTSISVAISFCCLLSVAGLLGPGRRWLNTSLIVISLFAGIYVGVRSWQKRKEPVPAVGGRCPDCGREFTLGQKSCALCGRDVSGEGVKK